MNMIEGAKNQINEIINDACGKARAAGALPGVGPLSGAVEIPREAAHGDYAATHAMAAAKELKLAPKRIAETLAGYIDLDGSYFRAYSIAGPGFINFFLSGRWYSEVLHTAEAMGGEYGAVDIGKGKRVMVEFVSANPTGPMTIGNARGGVLGDTLASILQRAGYDVWREFYVNDTGNQVELLAKSVRARYIQRLKGDGACEFPADGYQGSDIRDMADKFIEEHGDKYLDIDESACLNDMRSFALKNNIAKMKADIGRYRIEFDEWFLESGLHESGYLAETVELLRKNGCLYEKDGATWFRSTRFGCDKDEVIVKSNGYYTYYAADIAYHRNKLEKRGFDTAIDVLGADHHGHSVRFRAGLSGVGIDPEKLEFALYQLVHLVRDGETVRMSKRTGESVTLGDLLDEITPDAARFLFNNNSPNTRLVFDLGLAVRQDSENPVYYVQYAHARICSLIAMLGREGFNVPEYKDIDAGLLGAETELELIKQISILPEEITLAARDYDPSRINKYLIELAARFHRFYGACRIKGEERGMLMARLKLADTARAVIKNCLNLLGVSAPEKM